MLKKLFDLNRDGKISPLEFAIGMDAIRRIDEAINKQEESDEPIYSGNMNTNTSDARAALKHAGIDSFDMMDDDELRAALDEQNISTDEVELMDASELRDTLRYSSEFRLTEEGERMVELADAGLNLDDLKYMDELDRAQALESAGLDPYDYEDLDFDLL